MDAPESNKWYGDCKRSRCDFCIDGVNPYDFTQWGYIKKTEKHIDDVKICKKGEGDKYLGVVENECTCDQDEVVPEHGGIKYKRYAKDCPPPTKGSSNCIGDGFCNIGKCHASGNGYGKCGLCGFHNKYHYWYQRDWDKTLKNNEDKAECCAMAPSTDGRTKHCPPDRWYASPNCLGTMTKYCTSESWKSGTPSGKSCDYYMTSNMEESNGIKQNAGGVFSSALEDWATRTNGKKLQANDPFIDTALKWCNYDKLKGTCSPYLQQVCDGVTKQDLINDKTGKLAKTCACFLNSTEYLLPGIIPPECDSTCHLVSDTGGIPIYEYGGAKVGMEPKVCEQTTCVMDDVTINYVNSQVGKTNLKQMCGNCGSGGAGSCTCVMNNVNINDINSIVSKNTDLKQSCGVISQHGKEKYEGPLPEDKDVFGSEPQNPLPMGMFLTMLIVALAMVLVVVMGRR